LHGSSFFSFTNHTIESVVYSSQSHTWVSSESSCQRLPGLQWHHHRPDRRSARSYSHRQFEVRGIWLQSMALGASAVDLASRPSATDGVNSRLLFWPDSKRVVTSSHRGTRRAAYP
jgi:hypothetical protein